MALLEAALDYASRGRKVFPLRPNAKEPLTEHGVLDATDDPTQIRTWWEKWPTANIGMACGITSGLVVVDIDFRNGGTDDGFPDTLMVESGGGIHRYYSVDRALRGTVLRPGVDFLADGKYVVLPPSVHPSGKVYTRKGGAVTPFPMNLLPQPTQTRSVPTQSGLDTLSEGSRNASLASLAGSMRAKGCSLPTILSALQAENHARCVPPLPEWEVQKIAQSIDRYQPGPKLELIRASSVQKEEVKWIWNQRIPAGKISVLEGDPGLGKSTLSAALVAAVTAGVALPGTVPAIFGSAIIASAEDGYADTLVPRLEAAGADLGKVLFLAGLDLSRASHGIALEREIGDDVKLIIIDPLMAYLGGTDSYRDQAIREILSRCTALAQRTGAAFLLIRHWNKNNDSSDLYRGGGSIGITAAARSVLVVKKTDDPYLRVLESVKCNLGQKPEDLMFVLTGNPPRIEFRGTEPHS